MYSVQCYDAIARTQKRARFFREQSAAMSLRSAVIFGLGPDYRTAIKTVYETQYDMRVILVVNGLSTTLHIQFGEIQ